MKFKAFLLSWQVWQLNAADLAAKEVAESLAEIQEIEAARKANLNLKTEVQTNSSEYVDWYRRGSRWYRGPSRRRFVLHYWPDMRKGLTRDTFIKGYRRRWRHECLRPNWLQRNNNNVQKQDLYWCNWGGISRICNDWDNRCLDANGGHQNDLYWYPCHTGSNQQYWFGYWWSGGRFHVLTNDRRRRQRCVDYGGGRLYIHPCHNGGNQIFKYTSATTTTTTSTSTTTTTTLVQMIVKTFMLPEKMAWTIHKKGKKVCSGSKYSQWYSKVKTDCKLPSGTYTLSCMDKTNNGWFGGYMIIKGRKYCHNKQFQITGKKMMVKFRI